LHGAKKSADFSAWSAVALDKSGEWLCRWERAMSMGVQIFFSVDAQISNTAASDSLGNLAPERQRPRIWCSQRALHGQWPAIGGPETAAFPSRHCP
jgi:hypothetical protein